MHPTPTDTTAWMQAADPLRIRFLCQRFGLSKAAAQILAPMIYGEARQ